MRYPLTLTFDIRLVGARVRVVDAAGALVAYVQQRSLRLREDVPVFADEARAQLLYRIRADRAIDIGATYTVTSPDGRPFGAVRQQGLRSLWRAAYDVVDEGGALVARIREEDPWVKMLDALIGSVPVLGWIAQMWVNPSYVVEGVDGTRHLRLRKRASLLERSMDLTEIAPAPPAAEVLLLPAVIVVTLLERDRG